MPSRALRQDDAASQLGRFLAVGVGNTVLSFVVYRLLLAVATPYVLAAGLGFAVGALNGYVFNRRWTFAARDSTRARARLYVVVQVAGSLSTSLLVFLFVHAGAGKVVAYLAAISVAEGGERRAARPARDGAGERPDQVAGTCAAAERQVRVGDDGRGIARAALRLQ